MDEVLTIQEAVDILKRIPIANTRELKAVCMAVDALEEKWRERWRPVMDGDGEMPPTDEDGYSEYIRARIEACHTDDGIDHGRHHIEECFWAIIEKYEDGYIYCPITWSGGTCEECMEIFERRMERYD